ncbi:uncharacterized protein [Typha latifolia]|uniref:uncharacterized protein n=1 Tax=Typha latifolia TaxID=4733 RepID=UPI003C30590E
MWALANAVSSLRVLRFRSSYSSTTLFYPLSSRHSSSSSSSSQSLFSPTLLYPPRLLRMEPFSAASTSSSSTSRRGGRGRGREFSSREDRQRGGGGRAGGDSSRIDALGRLLTRILRHMASELKLDMRSDGYVRVRDLLKLSITTHAKVPLKAHTAEEIKEAVRRDNKQRFSLLEEDGELMIRANQGHTMTTVTSESLLKPILSADEVTVCVHGTYRKNLESILQSGLRRMTRLHVHFSCGLPTDGEVVSGMRRDVNILIYLDTKKALQDGMKLYISDNKVILTEGFEGVVPVRYFEKIETWPRRESIPFLRSHKT